MSAPISGKLRFIESWSAGLAREDAARAGQGECHHVTSQAQKYYLQESLCSSSTRAQHEQAFTLDWFEAVERQRHEKQARWIPRLLEFGRHRGEKILGIGDGLGTDWLAYARHGAEVVVCGSKGEQLQITRSNFELRGIPGQFLHASPGAIPLEAGSIDVVCFEALRHTMKEIELSVHEIYRVLKPGGKVLALVPASFDMHYWSCAIFPWSKWLSDRRANTIAELGEGLSARELRGLFQAFTIHRIHKRHLRRVDVPHIWRWIPRSVLARFVGRVLILKAFKPVSTAITSTHIRIKEYAA